MGIPGVNEAMSNWKEMPSNKLLVLSSDPLVLICGDVRKKLLRDRLAPLCLLLTVLQWTLVCYLGFFFRLLLFNRPHVRTVTSGFETRCSCQ